jgi:hypothetical protein
MQACSVAVVEQHANATALEHAETAGLTLITTSDELIREELLHQAMCGNT